jgi:hypothetical protein
VIALRQKRREVLSRFVGEFGPREPYCIKAEIERRLADRRFGVRAHP